MNEGDKEGRGQGRVGTRNEWARKEGDKEGRGRKGGEKEMQTDKRPRQHQTNIEYNVYRGVGKQR